MVRLNPPIGPSDTSSPRELEETAATVHTRLMHANRRSRPAHDTIAYRHPSKRTTEARTAVTAGRETGRSAIAPQWYASPPLATLAGLERLAIKCAL